MAKPKSGTPRRVPKAGPEVTTELAEFAIQWAEADEAQKAAMWAEADEQRRAMIEQRLWLYGKRN